MDGRPMNTHESIRKSLPSYIVVAWFWPISPELAQIAFWNWAMRLGEVCPQWSLHEMERTCHLTSRPSPVITGKPTAVRMNAEEHLGNTGTPFATALRLFPRSH